MSTKNLRALFLFTNAKKWLVVSCILMLLFMVNKFAFPAQTFASAVPGGNVQNSVVRAVDIDKPAVVRILTTLKGTLTVHFPNQGSATFPLNGGKYKLELSGSGAFISSHGDVLTADHVVQPPHDASMDGVLQKLAAKDVANYINQNFAPAISYTSNEVYNDLSFHIFASQPHYDAPTSEVYLSTDYTGLINATSLTTMSKSLHAPVDKVEGKSDVNKNDIAIVHVNMEDTPSITLGDSSTVAQQDNLTIIGFPGNGDLGDTDKPDPTMFLTSSVNQIYVSSVKQNSNQGTLIQVGGNVEHGDSGGPALNNKGNIVGIVSFYDQNADTPVGTSFLQASSSVQDVLTTLSSINLKPGKFQQAWQQAFTHYTSTRAGHWHQASTDFKAIQKKYPDFQVVASFADYSAEQAKHEILASPEPPLSIFVVLLIIIIIILILILPAILLARRRKNKLIATATISALQNYPPSSQAFVSSSQTASANNESVPAVTTDPPKHFNPYAPQPMSWQAFQELASPNAPVTYESNNPSEDPTAYESNSPSEDPMANGPLSDEKTEHILPAQATEHVSFSPTPDRNIEDEKPDSTDKIPRYR